MTFDTGISSPNGAKDDSLGQRPGSRVPQIYKALKRAAHP
jgi:hypothetical protein